MFSKQLKKYRKEKRLTQEDLAIKLTNILGRDIKMGNISSWETRVNPRLDVVSALAEIFDIPEQFLFNDDDTIINEIVNLKMPTFNAICQSSKTVQLYDGNCGECDGGIIYNPSFTLTYIDRSYIAPKYQNDSIMGLTIVGDCMQSYVNENDIVLFSLIKERNKKLLDGKYIINTQNGTKLRNISFRIDETIVISCCNKNYPDEIINKDESQEIFEIIGIVVGRILMS